MQTKVCFEDIQSRRFQDGMVFDYIDELDQELQTERSFFAERKSICLTGRNVESSLVIVCKSKSVFQTEMFKVNDSKETKEQNDGGEKREGRGRVIERKLEKERKNA